MYPAWPTYRSIASRLRVLRSSSSLNPLLHLSLAPSHRSSFIFSTTNLFRDSNREQVEDFAWKDVHRRESAEAPISSVDSENIVWRERARHAYQTNLHWPSRAFTSWVLNTQWRSRYHSVLALSSTTLAVGAGNTIYTYVVSQGSVREDIAIQVHLGCLPATDITGLAFLPNSGATRQMLITDMSGHVMRIRTDNATTSFSDGRPRLSGRWYGKSSFASQTARYDHPPEAIKALSTSGSMALTISTTGLLSLFNASTPWVYPSTYKSQETGWSCHLQLDASTPFAATGLQSGASVIPIRESGFDSNTPPLARLSGHRNGRPVYAISPFLPGASPNIIATGWYDGKVRVHDLRLPTTSAESTSAPSSPSPSPLSDPPILKPVLTLSDPWRSWDAIYSLSARGVPSPSGNHSHHYITAGSAQHSVVAIWDVRSPREGWSVYAPGGDRSPVYALVTEGSRIWGTTQSRAFMLDFAWGRASRGRQWPRVEGVERDRYGAFAAGTYSHY